MTSSLPGPFKNYRKAKKGEACCNECIYIIGPEWFQTRMRCGATERKYCIGKTMTCDYADRREKKDEM